MDQGSTDSLNTGSNQDTDDQVPPQRTVPSGSVENDGNASNLYRRHEPRDGEIAFYPNSVGLVEENWFTITVLGNYYPDLNSILLAARAPIQQPHEQRPPITFYASAVNMRQRNVSCIIIHGNLYGPLPQTLLHPPDGEQSSWRVRFISPTATQD